MKLQMSPLSIMEIQTEIGEKFKLLLEHLIKNDEVISIHKDSNDAFNKMSEMLESSKIMFLSAYGKYLRNEDLAVFLEFSDDTSLGLQIRSAVMHLEKYFEKRKCDEEKLSIQTKNRRFEALKELIAENNYFSDSEMMKRSPLLYEQLIGQYLTESERRARDRIKENDTFVKILMEGIERDNARELKQQQQDVEKMEEDDESSDNDSGIEKPTCFKPTPSASHSQWGEFPSETVEINKEEFLSKPSTSFIGDKQRDMLRDEFVTLMYESFLAGEDKDFDYNQVDHNDKYDNLEVLSQDLEDKYFDSEEANEDAQSTKDKSVTSEDDLDIFMESLHKSHPSVTQLSSEFEKL